MHTQGATSLPLAVDISYFLPTPPAQWGSNLATNGLESDAFTTEPPRRLHYTLIIDFPPCLEYKGLLELP